MSGAIGPLDRAEVIALVREVVARALADLDPAKLVVSSLPPLPPKRARVLVVAAGKAAVPMIEGAIARWPEHIHDAIAIAPEGSPAPSSRAVALHTAPHPIPDARSVAAAEEALARAASLTTSDVLVALISGGASALLASPPRGSSLDDKRVVVRALLDAGASIRDVNLVRRHLSRVKGGGLARAASPARTLTLAMSDVIGGAPHDIGSGPSVPDPTTIDDARAVLRRLAIDEPAGLAESLKPGEVRARAKILADPHALAVAAARALDARGFRATVDPPDEGDAITIVDRRVARAATLAPGEAALVATEPTLKLPASRGRGGRAGFVALAAMRRLPPGVALACVASDGVDGSSGGAGAVVMRAWADASDDVAIDRALGAFDDASVHAQMETTLDLARTSHNLADLHMIVRLFSDR